MDLRITTTHGSIGMNITQGKMNIDYGKSNFDIQTKNSKIDMEITQPKVNIDQSKPMREMGLKNIFDFIDTNVQRGRRAALSGIAKTVHQGNELARIETGSSPISSQARYNAFDQFKKEVNIGFIPKSRPEINLDEGSVNINVERGEVNVQSKSQEVNLNCILGKVEIYLRQKPFIDVEYIGNNLDIKI